MSIFSSRKRSTYFPLIPTFYSLFLLSQNTISAFDAKISKRCLCSDHYYTALIKEKFLVNTALIMTMPKVSISF